MIGVPGGQCSVVSCPPELRPQRVARPRESRRMSQVCTIPVPNNVYMNHANSRENLIRTMRNRVLTYKGTQPITPSPEGKAVLDSLVHLYHDEKPEKVYPLSEEAFLSHYTGRKLARYSEAFQWLRERPLTEKDAKVSTFIKNEKFDFLAKGHDADPRAIQPRKPVYLASVGLWFKPLEGIIYKDMARKFGSTGPIVAKGLNAEQTATCLHNKWTKFSDPVCVSLDASRFDLHVSQEVLEFTHKIYDGYCRDQRLRTYLKWTLVNRGTASCSDTAYKYEVKGRRMSGDMDTALGNCLIMTVLTWYMLKHQFKIDKFEILNNGDDCLFIIERPDEPSPKQLQDFYRQFGFVVRLEGTVSVFERIEFCQTQPVWRGDTWVMMRQPRSFAKDICNVNPGGAPYLEWLRAVAVCGGVLTDGMPIGPAFYDLLFRSGSVGRIQRSVFWECGMTHMMKGMKRVERPVLTETRLSYERAFGISVSRQLALEELYRSMDRIDNNTIHQWPTKLREAYASGVEFG